MDNAIKEVVCYMPLSQPFFFGTMLFIWALTCIGDLRVCFEKLWRFVVITPTVPSMAEALQFGDVSVEVTEAKTVAANEKDESVKGGQEVIEAQTVAANENDQSVE